MKNSIHKIIWLTFLTASFLLTLFYSCREESKNEVLSPSAIQFSASVQNVTEGNEAIISLMLENAAVSDGWIAILVETTAIYNRHFETNPVVDDGLLILLIERGQKEVDISVSAIDNALFEGSMPIIFSLTHLSEGFKAGAQNSLTLTIGDDEGPSLANFAINTGTVNENSTEGIVIQIPLSAPAKGEGSVTIAIDPGEALYNTNFTTEPSPTNNTITFTIAENQEAVELVVVPVANELFTDNFVLGFSIDVVSGVVEKGNNLNYSLTIDDDEEPSVANFKSNAGTIGEEDVNGIVVPVTFSTAAFGTGSLIFTISSNHATYGDDFITSPAATDNLITLNVLPGETGADFTVIPNHNYVATEDLQITFTLSTVTGVVWKGTSLAYSLTIINVDEEALVNFETNEGSLDENNASGIDVEIPFSAQAPGEGSITISLSYAGPGNGDYNLTTIPSTTYSDYYHNKGTIVLDVVAGQTKASFKIIPVSNSYCNSERLLHCKISFAFGSVKKGANLDYDLKLIDDEEAIYVNFAESSGMVNESNASGIVVNLTLSKPAINADGAVYISGPYGGSVYSTNPEMVEDYYSYSLILPVQNATGILFTALPINNGTDNSNYLVDFTMNAYSNSGCVRTGPNATYSLTIVDDD